MALFSKHIMKELTLLIYFSSDLGGNAICTTHLVSHVLLAFDRSILDQVALCIILKTV